MPDVEEKKTVDIDTSGPGADIELPEEEKESNSVEVSNEQLKAILSPMTHLRNLMTSLLFKQTRIKQKKTKS